jgi:hypothetical protein
LSCVYTPTHSKQKKKYNTRRGPPPAGHHRAGADHHRAGVGLHRAGVGTTALGTRCQELPLTPGGRGCSRHRRRPPSPLPPWRGGMRRMKEDRHRCGGRGGGGRRRRQPRLGREDEEVGHEGDEVTTPAAMLQLQGTGGCTDPPPVGRSPPRSGLRSTAPSEKGGGGGRGADKATVPAATRQNRPPHAGSGLHAPDRGRRRSMRLAAPPRSATARRGRRRLTRPAAPPRQWSAAPSRPTTANRSCMRAMCGSRTGGWSLPSVMSD